MPVDAHETTFELVTVFGEPMLFCCYRINRETVPAKLHCYGVRHDDDQQGIPVEIAHRIFVNHWGDLISKTPIGFPPGDCFRLLDEDDFNYEGVEMTLANYLKF